MNKTVKGKISLWYYHYPELIFWGCVKLFGGLVFFSGLCTFGYQIYFWIRNGEWFELDLLWFVFFAIRRLPEEYLTAPVVRQLLRWLTNPTDWTGLQKLLTGTLDLIPLVLFLGLFGGVLWFFGSEGFEKEDRTIRDLKV